jgi:hypothetical protein
MLLFSDFMKENNWHFCLFKIATQGVSSWHFHVELYYNTNWFISSIFILNTFRPFLMVISTSFKILYSFLYREYINHIHLLASFFYPSPLLCYHPLAWPIFHNIAIFVLVWYSTYERKSAAFVFLNLVKFT